MLWHCTCCDTHRSSAAAVDDAGDDDDDETAAAMVNDGDAMAMAALNAAGLPGRTA